MTTPKETLEEYQKLKVLSKKKKIKLFSNHFKYKL